MSERHPDIYNEFDLEAARKAGQAYERKRIIKLIDQHQRDINWTETHFKYSKALWVIKDLIKGEQK
jgi:hypothetical protein